MTDRHPHILCPGSTVLVVVDMQEPFLAVMHGRESLVANVRLLSLAAQALGVPVIPTLQYAQRLGGVAPEVADALPEDALVPLDKMTFSCVGNDTFLLHLRQTGRRQVLLCGVETHICVSQTALDLTHLGYQVHVAADAVSARTVEKHKLGMERIRDSGVLPCAAEAAIYEMLGAAGTPAFKQILPLVR